MQRRNGRVLSVPCRVVNLLPRPRRVELTGTLVDAQPLRERVDPSVPPQGYELRIAEDGMDLVGADDAGLFYGRATLAQLLRLHAGSLPTGVIRDHPDIPVRGVMLDVSR